MAALCAPDTDEAAQRRIESDVDLLVAFARAYPDASFPIDDETGRSLGLLLIARKEMQVCAPDRGRPRRTPTAIPGRPRHRRRRAASRRGNNTEHSVGPCEVRRQSWRILL
ncbi:hypothetical protein CBI38_35960 (plasmid) [Rhodococcus oxybenzonivorans]|uniref:Uncharacterized protein n=1 Tax=Rhodococcus oxybenzonivorans TaxID=1990687 RepID=A0A2S2C7E8_9NOCA|nr:hypothetical protein [Rhodococcus oxybenzonivorans]AWK76806.1 hypothetical protein CBI38_35960 [Rhodococcus oxybenzonivorans]